jgi:hypothetical protein
MQDSRASIDSSLASRPTPPPSITSGAKIAIRRATRSIVSQVRQPHSRCPESEEQPDTWWRHFYGRKPQAGYKRQHRKKKLAEAREILAGSTSLNLQSRALESIHGDSVGGHDNSEGRPSTQSTDLMSQHVPKRLKRRRTEVSKREQATLGQRIREVIAEVATAVAALVVNGLGIVFIALSTCCCGCRFSGIRKLRHEILGGK